jgi:transposase-like protein
MKLLRPEPLKALVIGAFVRGLSMRDVESWCEQAGSGRLSRSTASRICSELRERFEACKRRDRYDVQLAALFLDAVLLCVRPDGPRRASWSPGAVPKRANACCCRCCWGWANRPRTGSSSGAT